FKLAALWIGSNQLDKVFADNSPIRNLLYRSLALKNRADRELLRQQVSKGNSNEEKTIALHTLLLRDLMQADYQQYLQDKPSGKQIPAVADKEQLANTALSRFDWAGDKTDTSYPCDSLEQQVTILATNPQQGRALNCLAAFYRDTGITLDSHPWMYDSELIKGITEQEWQQVQPDRLKLYQQVIASPHSEVEDKAYALYRAINCYAPGGYNECGGPGVDKNQRKAWFQQLKRDYKGTSWAQELKYYW
ncbi:MAG: hypothetical protein ACRC5A_11340, partial [Enterobacteriaceae bacterium]